MLSTGRRTVAVGVPAGIARVQVAVAAGVVEVLAANAGSDVVYPRVVEKRAQVLALVREWEYRRPGDAVVLATVMPTAVGRPDRLELLDDPVDAVGQQTPETPGIRTS